MQEWHHKVERAQSLVVSRIIKGFMQKVIFEVSLKNK